MLIDRLARIWAHLTSNKSRCSHLQPALLRSQEDPARQNLRGMHVFNPQGTMNKTEWRIAGENDLIAPSTRVDTTSGASLFKLLCYARVS